MAKGKEQNAGQTNIQTPPAKGWGDVVSQARERPELFPKLNLNGPDGKNKHHEGIVDVLVLDDEPRSVEYEDPFAEEEGTKGTAFVFNVQVLAGGNDPAGSSRALFVPSDPSHGLTSGVSAVSKKHGNKLRGVALRIETKNYDNKRYKTKTRGYTVSEIPAPAQNAP